MTTVKDIEKALENLPKSRLIEFREWFEKFDAKEWDDQFEQDVKSGALDQLAEEAATTAL